MCVGKYCLFLSIHEEQDLSPMTILDLKFSDQSLIWVAVTETAVVTPSAELSSAEWECLQEILEVAED